MCAWTRCPNVESDPDTLLTASPTLSSSRQPSKSERPSRNGLKGGTLAKHTLGHWVGCPWDALTKPFVSAQEQGVLCRRERLYKLCSVCIQWSVASDEAGTPSWNDESAPSQGRRPVSDSPALGIMAVRLQQMFQGLPELTAGHNAGVLGSRKPLRERGKPIKGRAKLTEEDSSSSYRTCPPRTLTS